MGVKVLPFDDYIYGTLKKRGKDRTITTAGLLDMILIKSVSSSANTSHLNTVSLFPT